MPYLLAILHRILKLKFLEMNIIKIKLESQNAKPGSPLGPILGQAAIPMKPFIDEFNKTTLNIKKGIPLKIYIKKKTDKSYKIINKGPLLSFLIEVYLNNPSLLNFYKLVKIKKFFMDKDLNNNHSEKEIFKNV